MKQKLLAFIELITATFFWGFGFIATKWALEASGPLKVTWLRFGGAFIFGIVLYLFNTSLAEHYRYLKKSFVASLFLGLALILQTYGLKGSSAAQSAFITGLYIVFIPLFNALIFKKWPEKQFYYFLILAIYGFSELINFNIYNLSINHYDLMTLLCAIAASLHILIIDQNASSIEKPFLFNVWSSFWIFAMTFVIEYFLDYTLIDIINPDVIATHFLSNNSTVTDFLISEHPNWMTVLFKKIGTLNLKLLFSYAMLIFGSTLFAFALQIKSQKVLSPHVAGLLFLLESPFALLFGFLLLNERLNSNQFKGIFILVIASLGAWYFSNTKRPRKLNQKIQLEK